MDFPFYFKFTLKALVIGALLNGVLIISYKLFSAFKLRSQFPGFQANQLLIYWMWFRVVRSVKHLQPGAIFLQLMHGMAEIFKNDGMWSIWIGLRPTFFLIKPSCIQIFMSSSTSHEKSVEYEIGNFWMKDSSALCKYEKWRKHRKMLNPAFHSKPLQDYMPVFNEQTAILITKLKGLVSEPWVDIYSLLSSCTLDVILQAAMDYGMGTQEGNREGLEYLEALEQMPAILLTRGMRPWLYSDFIFNFTSDGKKYLKIMDIINSCSKKVIETRMKSTTTHENNLSVCQTDDDSIRKKRRDFLEILIEYHRNDPSFTLENVRAEVNLFIFGGFETVALTVSWALLLLGLNPDAQEKVFQEQDSIFQSDPNKPVTSDDLYSMKYLESVLKETLRLYPPGSLVGRQAQEDITIGKYKIPAGTSVFIAIYMIHRDPEIYPNPERFDPDRFSPENSTKIPSSAFLPFSVSPRNCIGQKFAMMEMKVILSHICRNFRIQSLVQRDQIILKWGPTLQCAEPLHIKFIPRH